MSQESDPSPSPWRVYIIENRLGQFYTGITTDVTRRIAQHRGEIKGGAKSMRGKGPLAVKLVVISEGRSNALKLEAAIKKLNRSQKEQLIAHQTLNGVALDCEPVLCSGQ